MKKRHLIPLALLLFMALVTPRGVGAQVLYGSLMGNVTDQSGAVVAGAKVEALNIGTGALTSVVTDERGAYLFSSLQAGIYKLTITARTFKTLAQANAVGAAVNVITKSGTNEFHGSAFEYHTDNALKALNRFNPIGVRQNKFILNQYGGSVGGPIKKNKLFFFADWEATKRRQLASRTATVINPKGIFDAAGNANLSAAIPAGTNCNVTRVAGCIYDPNTGNADGSGRLAFTGNIIPANRIDPAVKTLLGRIDPAGFLNNDGVTANGNYNRSSSALANPFRTRFRTLFASGRGPPMRVTDGSSLPS